MRKLTKCVVLQCKRSKIESLMTCKGIYVVCVCYSNTHNSTEVQMS